MKGPDVEFLRKLNQARCQNMSLFIKIMILPIFHPKLKGIHKHKNE